MPKNWSNRDWIWLMSILIFIIIFVSTGWIINLSDSETVVSFISFAATGISIALAIVAMAIAISQNNSSQNINAQITNTLTKIDTKVSGLSENFSSLITEKTYSINDFNCR